MTALASQPDWPAPTQVRAWFSQRTGGISRDAYASLNLAAQVGDEQERVSENRRRLSTELELPGEPQWLEQVHGNRIVNLDDAWEGQADGAVTGRPGVVCAVLTADCLPVLIAARSGARVAAVHAGWRGLLHGVLPAALAAMATPPADNLAWLGPCIGADAYEVGDEVRAAFVNADPGTAAAFRANERGRWQADLPALARRQLETLGVNGVYGGKLCTFSDPERFFSHRREAPCGRMATLIWREAPR